MHVFQEWLHYYDQGRNLGHRIEDIKGQLSETKLKRDTSIHKLVRLDTEEQQFYQVSKLLRTSRSAISLRPRKRECSPSFLLPEPSDLAARVQ